MVIWLVLEAAVVSSLTKKEQARNTKKARAPQLDGFLNARSRSTEKSEGFMCRPSLFAPMDGLLT